MNRHDPGLWALLIFSWFAASALYRRLRGKPVFASALPDATFVERWASGRTGSGLLARLSTARHCLQVQVTPTRLLLNPHFPFTLGFLPELYGYDHAIDRRDIRSVRLLGGLFTKAVEVHYVDRAGSAQVLQLLLRRGVDFVAKVAPPADAAQ